MKERTWRSVLWQGRSGTAWLHDMADVVVSGGHRRWCPAYVESEDAPLNATSRWWLTSDLTPSPPSGSRASMRDGPCDWALGCWGWQRRMNTSETGSDVCRNSMREREGERDRDRDRERQKQRETEKMRTDRERQRRGERQRETETKTERERDREEKERERQRQRDREKPSSSLVWNCNKIAARNLSTFG